MTDYSNWKILKSLIYYDGENTETKNKSKLALTEYSNVSLWCNETGEYYIDDTDPDYFIVKPNPKPTTKEQLLEEYSRLKKYLEETDYITNKLAEVVDDMIAYEEMKQHYSEQLSIRQLSRERIREIEDELKDL